MAIADKVKELIAKYTETPLHEVRPKRDFIEDLSIDSLGVVELVLAIETEFELDVTDEDVERIRTVQQVIDYVVARKGGGE